MFLLGAGASVDAGLESSVGLTKAIAERLGRGAFRNPTGQLLHSVIGAMVQHDASGGGDAFAVPDVERVFSAVTKLKLRDDLDIAAFVDRWNGSLDTIAGPSGLPGSWAREFRESLSGESAADLELQAAFERGVSALTEPTSSSLFADLEQRMRMALVQVLKVEPEKVSYLNPMVSSTDLCAIATLNYDLSVETACSRIGLSVDIGLDRWKGGYGWDWTPGTDLRLLKLHGSLDYVLHRARPIGGRMTSEHLVGVGDEVGANPALIFGLGSKLRSDGPFLAMLVEFDRLLAKTEWLTIVGYSFRDDHINAALTRWMNGSIARRLSVVDPDIEKWMQSGGVGPNYFSRLHRGSIGEGYEFGSQATWTSIQTDFLPMGAAKGLAQLHS